MSHFLTATQVNKEADLRQPGRESVVVDSARREPAWGTHFEPPMPLCMLSVGLIVLKLQHSFLPAPVWTCGREDMRTFIRGVSWIRDWALGDVHMLGRCKSSSKWE